MTVIPEEYVNSICEVKSLQNTLLATGRLLEINDNSIKITNPGDTITVLKFGTRVKVNILNPDMNFMALVGNVYLSTPAIMEITDVCTLAEAEKRSFFRINTDLHGVVTYLSGEEKKKVHVHIENISLCGALFSGKLQLNIGETVDLLIKLPFVHVPLKAQVRRIETGDTKQKYGVEFVEPGERLIDQLWVFILQKQSEEIRSRKRAQEYDR